MKQIYKITTFLVCVTLLASCSKEYLDTKPTSSTGTSTIFSSAENAALAINGICKLMNRQYLSSQGFNGEGTIKMYWGDYPGNAMVTNYSSATFTAVINQTYHDNTTTMYNYYAWYYYYMIIGNANSVIVNIDEATGSEKDKQFVKAQALTFRAYAFTMLAQLYCNRWKDSNNGSSNGLVLRLDTSSGEMPLCTLAQVYEQIYTDLNDAVNLYTQSGRKRPSGQRFLPDISVAYATYARAALNREDYSTAATMAVKARTGYPLMTNDEYNSGFNTPNQEWIWGCYGSEDESLFFYAFHAYIGYNASSSAVRTYPKRISKELYEKIPTSDLRRKLFLDPLNYSYTASTGKASKALDTYARSIRPNLYSTATVYTYMNFKFSNIAQAGVGHVVNFRSAEMYLIEAEAKYFMGDANGAIDALISLNRGSGRDPQYNGPLDGEDLLDEIKFYRAIELWGEGFNWFDLKRWGDSIDRKTSDEGGNFLPQHKAHIGPSDKNAWTWMIPIKETDYNEAL